MIYDGQLTLNLGGETRRSKNIDLYVLLLEDCVMFLQKQDEKYLLKFHTVSGGLPGNRDDMKNTNANLGCADNNTVMSEKL